MLELNEVRAEPPAPQPVEPIAEAPVSVALERRAESLTKGPGLWSWMEAADDHEQNEVVLATPAQSVRLQIEEPIAASSLRQSPASPSLRPSTLSQDDADHLAGSLQSHLEALPQSPPVEVDLVAASPESPVLSTALAETTVTSNSVATPLLASSAPPIEQQQAPLLADLPPAAPSIDAPTAAPSLNAPDSAPPRPPGAVRGPRFPLLNACASAGVGGLLTAGATQIGAHLGYVKAIGLATALNPLGVFLLGACVTSLFLPNLVSSEPVVAPAADLLNKIKHEVSRAAPQAFRYASWPFRQLRSAGSWASNHPRVTALTILITLWAFIDAASLGIVVKGIIAGVNAAAAKAMSLMGGKALPAPDAAAAGEASMAEAAEGATAV